MIIIDGQHSGGQTLRSALSLSAATGKSFRIINIRGKREESGIKPQHLAAINAVAALCDAEVKGNFKGSHELEFVPHEISKRKLVVDIGTAGSSTLLLQTLIPACLHSAATTMFIINGGTDTTHCPGSHYFAHVFCNFLHQIGLQFTFAINRYGFYPKGCGELSFILEPTHQLKEISFVERGKLEKVDVHAVVSKDLEQRNVAERLVKGFRLALKTSLEVHAKMFVVDTLSTGCFIHSHVHCENYKVGDGALGERNVKAEAVGKNCADKINKLLQREGVDRYAADQLMIYMALKGKGEVLVTEVTDHVRTNAMVIERFLPVQFIIKGNLITCGPVV